MVELADHGGDFDGSDDEEDDIARFERQCAERARLEGLAGGEEDDGSDEESSAQARALRSVRIANGTSSPQDGDMRRKYQQLQEKLGRRELELTQLRADMDLMKSDEGSKGDQIASELKQRLLDLTKRNRRLTVTNETQRTKIQQLEAELKKPREEAKKQADEVAAQNSAALLGDGFEDWKQKYLVASNKLQETRHEVQDLRAQAQRHKKVLAKELGSEEVIEKALAVADDPNSSQWRGRQAQIAQLQRQVRELREQVKRGGAAGAEDADLGAPVDAAIAGGETPPQKARKGGREQASERDRQGITQAAEKRREEFERLQEEAEQLRGEVTDLKRKREAAKSRKDVLEGQVKELRASVQTLLQKSENDDALVAAMRRQLGRPDGPTEDPFAGAAPGDVEALRQENAELQAQVDRQAQIVLRLQQKNLEKSYENGSARLGPRSVEDATGKNELIERVRYLEAENAKQGEQVRLLRRQCGENPSAGGEGVDSSGRPFSAEATLNLKERLKATTQKLAAAERENQVLRSRVEDASMRPRSRSSSSGNLGDPPEGPDGTSADDFRDDEVMRRDIVRLRASQQASPSMTRGSEEWE